MEGHEDVEIETKCAAVSLCSFHMANLNKPQTITDAINISGKTLRYDKRILWEGIMIRSFDPSQSFTNQCLKIGVPPNHPFEKAFP